MFKKLLPESEIFRST